MGQKVHPYGFRLGYTKPWKSRWFVERDYDKLLLEDVKLKNELKDKLKSAGVSSIEVERPGNKLRVIIKTARPGIIIGRKGAEIDIDILFRAHVVGVFNCRAQQLFNFRRNPLFVERQRVQRIFHAPALNEFQHQARLLRRHANKSGLSSEFHF